MKKVAFISAVALTAWGALCLVEAFAAGANPARMLAQNVSRKAPLPSELEGGVNMAEAYVVKATEPAARATPARPATPPLPAANAPAAKPATARKAPEAQPVVTPGQLAKAFIKEHWPIVAPTVFASFAVLSLLVWWVRGRRHAAAPLPKLVVYDLDLYREQLKPEPRQRGIGEPSRRRKAA
jgi:hypothetical protein